MLPHHVTAQKSKTPSTNLDNSFPRSPTSQVQQRVPEQVAHHESRFGREGTWMSMMNTVPSPRILAADRFPGSRRRRRQFFPDRPTDRPRRECKCLQQGAVPRRRMLNKEDGEAQCLGGLLSWSFYGTLCFQTPVLRHEVVVATRRKSIHLPRPRPSRPESSKRPRKAIMAAERQHGDTQVPMRAQANRNPRATSTTFCVSSTPTLTESRRSSTP